MEHEFAKGGMKFLWVAVSGDITFRKGDIVPMIDQGSGMGTLIHEKMPRLPMDDDLNRYSGHEGLIDPGARRKFLQDHFGNHMMGRNLCITEGGLIGMGSGYMTAMDIVVLPFGCSTPIILRPGNRDNEYRYVSDVYIDGYMHGEALTEMAARDPRRVVSKYMLC